jgi:hypothetical protein
VLVFKVLALTLFLFHQCIFHPVTFPPKNDQVAVMGEPVNHGRCHLIKRTLRSSSIQPSMIGFHWSNLDS